eukprot:1356990-Amorphochlora_amoeboformis.AAC.2
MNPVATPRSFDMPPSSTPEEEREGEDRKDVIERNIEGMHGELSTLSVMLREGKGKKGFEEGKGEENGEGEGKKGFEEGKGEKENGVGKRTKTSGAEEVKHPPRRKSLGVLSIRG